MGIFTRLDVVNDMLGLLGEVGVNTLDEDHPLIAKALSTLRTANAREQARGWWFNTETLTLSPTAEKHIIVPSDVLQLDATATTLHVSQRGDRLYNLNPGTGSPHTFDLPVEVRAIRLLAFEDLPALAQMLVSHSAQYDFAVDNDGDDQKIRNLRAALQDALVTINAEHIRARDANLLRNPSFAATFAHIGGYPSRGLRHR